MSKESSPPKHVQKPLPSFPPPAGAAAYSGVCYYWESQRRVHNSRRLPPAEKTYIPVLPTIHIQKPRSSPSSTRSCSGTPSITLQTPAPPLPSRVRPRETMVFPHPSSLPKRVASMQPSSKAKPRFGLRKSPSSLAPAASHPRQINTLSAPRRFSATSQ